MEEENKDNMVETPEDSPEEEEVKVDPNEAITNMFTELLAEMKTINQTLNNINPVSEDPPAEDTPAEDTEQSEPSEEEIKEADRLLQED